MTVVLGSTISIYKQVLLNDQASIVLDRDSHSTVQPNLRNVNSTEIIMSLMPVAIRAWIPRVSDARNAQGVRHFDLAAVHWQGQV